MGPSAPPHRHQLDAHTVTRVFYFDFSNHGWGRAVAVTYSPARPETRLGRGNTRHRVGCRRPHRSESNEWILPEPVTQYTTVSSECVLAALGDSATHPSNQRRRELESVPAELHVALLAGCIRGNVTVLLKC